MKDCLRDQMLNKNVIIKDKYTRKKKKDNNKDSTMNIFFLWIVSNYVNNAKSLCDKHVVKMILETTQMLYAVQYRYSTEFDQDGKPIVPRCIFDALPMIEKKVRDKETRKMRKCPVKATPYKRTHRNHPMTLWVGSNIKHYNHAIQLALAMGKVYSQRYKNKRHACMDHIEILKQFPPEELTRISENLQEQDPPQCMPDEYKIPKDYVAAYRNYYINEKMKTFVDKNMFRYAIEDHKPDFIKIEEHNYVSLKEKQ